ncbi:autotransporter outer membrane beta-barrel domain-containing protein [Kalamiella sp. sgz302252]|uniref:autotransporter outer membrane beta-barrel domain-containing protein n=1 Tax=Pantoea sp. sgz302252 TaxID=3341827 RepID=UPI0036D3E70A
MLKKSLRLRAVGSALLFYAVSALPALGWDNLYVFGDSLSDGGNNGRFTWDGSRHPLYDEILAAKINQSLQPSSAGGNNYAVGSAVASPLLDADNNTASQVATYLAANGGEADGDGLYIHWIGGNDLAAAALNPLQAESIVSGSAFAASAQVQQLLAAGAGTVIVPTVPNIGASPALLEAVIQVGLAPVASAALTTAFDSLNGQTTPDLNSRNQAIYQALYAAAGQASSVAAVQQAIASQLYEAWQSLSGQASALTDSYNQQEESRLAQLSGNIVRVDVNGLFNEILSDPARYGLTNTAGMACPPGVSAAVCSTDTPGFSSEQAYLFADRLHPGPSTHQLIADYIQSVLDAPAQVVALNQATLALARSARATLDSRLQQQRHSDNQQGSIGIFGGYAGQHYDYAANLAAGDGNATGHNLTLGVDYKLTDDLLVGALVSGSDDAQHPSSRFDYKLRGWLFSAYSELSFLQDGWVNVDAHYAFANYQDIERSFSIGPAERTEKGDTEGKQVGARITAGWDIPLGERFTTGPTAQYALDYSTVDGYSEKGEDSTAMRFADQNYHSQIGAVGWRLDSTLGWISPWAEVSYNHQFGDDVWRAGGGIKSTRTSFVRDTARQDSNWTEVTVGANLPLGDSAAAFASVSQTGGLSSGEQFIYNLGVSARF